MSSNGLFELFSTKLKTQRKVRVIFQVKFELFLSPEINVGSIFKRGFYTLSGQLWKKGCFFYSFLIIPVFCGRSKWSTSGQPVLSSHPIIPCGQLLNPLTLMSDQDRISPYSINTISTRQVMRIKKYNHFGDN